LNPANSSPAYNNEDVADELFDDPAMDDLPMAEANDLMMTYLVMQI
jgi:hypothetical protein